MCKIKNAIIEINLPSSKSISNRVLILNALCNNKLSVKNLSTADDTKILQTALCSDEKICNLEGSGTAFRFFTAFAAATTRVERIVTGNERMLQRPVNHLVAALNHLGARVEFLGKTGLPPLKITPAAMRGGDVEIDASVSSQFISALMLIAAVLPHGLRMRLTGEIVSKPYIEMTRKLLGEFSILCDEKGDLIEIAPQKIVPAAYEIENDWTGASYWYEFLAVAGTGAIFLPNLQCDSIQGDKIVAEIFAKLGVKTEFSTAGITISASSQNVDFFEFNFINNPDLVQTVVVTCCLKKIPFRFTGIKNLRIKETDRVAALIAECRKIGCVLEFAERENTLSWNRQNIDIEQNIKISPHADHRMAMAFAPAALKFSLEIENQEVVTKSYPNFWKDMKNFLTFGF
ncbi:MAG: 3-phosphoshikimate 1-carboxyvinyltransferase [Prevotellaceae bacterium]|jgi:3-phosphoshikimate 1-carboxyvinyltransferase|nr:3-phosphoshikimate 1-carboxyvinyltransferase [Prevotellaceae bacterium]